MRFCFKYKRRKICLEVEKCMGARMGIGLMFKLRNTSALLFGFNRPFTRAIHSFFVFFPFFAVWLDDKNRVVEARVVKPFTFRYKSKRKFTRLVEIPISSKYKEQLEIIRR